LDAGGNPIASHVHQFMDLKSGKKQFGPISWKSEQVMVYDIALGDLYKVDGIAPTLRYDFFLLPDDPNPHYTTVVPVGNEVRPADYLARRDKVNSRLSAAYKFLTDGIPNDSNDPTVIITEPNDWCTRCPAYQHCPNKENANLRKAPAGGLRGGPYPELRTLTEKTGAFAKSELSDETLTEIIEQIINHGGTVREAIGHMKSDERELWTTKYTKFMQDHLSNKTNDIIADNKRIKETILQIGAVHITAPITNISLTDRKEVVTADTLRTKESLTLRKQTSNREANLTIIFSGKDQINYELRHILAQYQAFPFTQIRNKEITRMLIPLQSHLPTYFAVDQTLLRKVLTDNNIKDFSTQKGEAHRKDLKAARDEVYSKVKFMYAIRSISIAPVPSLVDTIELNLRIQVMDLDPVSETGRIRFLYDTQSALEQLGWFTHFCRLNEYRKNDTNGSKTIVDTIIPKEKAITISFKNATNHRKIDLGKYSVLAMPLYIGREDNTYFVNPGDDEFIDKDAYILLVRTPNRDTTTTTYTYLAFLYTRGLLLPIRESDTYLDKGKIKLPDERLVGPIDSLKTADLSYVFCTDLSVYTESAYSRRELTEAFKLSWNKLTAANFNIAQINARNGVLSPSTSDPRRAPAWLNASKRWKNFNTNGDIWPIINPTNVIDPFLTMIEIRNQSSNIVSGISAEINDLPWVSEHRNMQSRGVFGEWMYTSPVMPARVSSENSTGTKDATVTITGVDKSTIPLLVIQRIFRKLFLNSEVLFTTNLGALIKRNLPKTSADPKPFIKDLQKSFEARFQNAYDNGFYASGQTEAYIRFLTIDAIDRSNMHPINKTQEITVSDRKGTILTKHNIAFTSDNPNTMDIKSGKPKAEIDTNTFIVMPPIINKKYAQILISEYHRYSATTEVAYRLAYKRLGSDADATKIISEVQKIKSALLPSNTLYRVHNTFCKRMSEKGIGFINYRNAVEEMLYDSSIITPSAVTYTPNPNSTNGMLVRLDHAAANNLLDKIVGYEGQDITYYEKILNGGTPILRDDIESSEVTRDIKVMSGGGSNPAQRGLTVDSLSLSRPFIKYYTSLLAEYVDPDKYLDILERVPSYLYHKPYEQHVEFPLLQPYIKSGEEGRRNNIKIFFRSLRSSTFAATQEDKLSRAAFRTINDIVLNGIREIISGFMPGTSAEYRQFINSVANDPETSKLYNPTNCADCYCPHNADIKAYIDRQLSAKINKMAEDLGNTIPTDSSITASSTGAADGIAAKELIISIVKQLKKYPELVTVHQPPTEASYNRIVRAVHKQGTINPNDGAVDQRNPSRSPRFQSYLYIGTYIAGLLYLLMWRMKRFAEQDRDKNIVNDDVRRKISITMKLIDTILNNSSSTQDRLTQEIRGIFSGIVTDYKKDQSAKEKSKFQNLNVDIETTQAENSVLELSNLFNHYGRAIVKLKTMPTFIIKRNVDGNIINQRQVLTDRAILDSVPEGDVYHTIITSDIFETPNFRISSEVSILKDALLSSVLTLFDSFIPDLFFWKEINIENSKDRETNVTTITNFKIAQENNIVPVYMEGHEYPFPQCLGGSSTQLTIDFITDDMFLVENIAEAATELNIMMKKYNLIKNVNPLRRPAGTEESSSRHKQLNNLLTRDRHRRHLVNKLNTAINGKEPQISKSGLDTPMLIQNNIANMVGLYGCVITDIEIQSLPEKFNTFSIRLAMRGVDIHQSDRETPRRVSQEYDRALLLRDACTVPSYVIQIGEKELKTRGIQDIIMNISSRGEKIAAKLAIVALIANLEEAYNTMEQQAIANGHDATDTHMYDKTLDIMFSYVAKELTVPILQTYIENPTRTTAEAQIQSLLRNLLRRAENVLINVGGSLITGGVTSEKRSNWTQATAEPARLKAFWTSLHANKYAKFWSHALGRSDRDIDDDAQEKELHSTFLSTILIYLTMLSGDSDEDYYTKYTNDAKSLGDLFKDKAVLHNLMAQIRDNLIPDVGTWIPTVSAVLNFYQLPFLMSPYYYAQEDIHIRRTRGQRRIPSPKEITDSNNEDAIKAYNHFGIHSTNDYIKRTKRFQRYLRSSSNRPTIGDRIELARGFNNIITDNYFKSVRTRQTTWKEYGKFKDLLTPFKKLIQDPRYGLAGAIAGTNTYKNSHVFEPDKSKVTIDRITNGITYAKKYTYTDMFSIPSETFNSSDFDKLARWSTNEQSIAGMLGLTALPTGILAAVGASLLVGSGLWLPGAIVGGILGLGLGVVSSVIGAVQQYLTDILGAESQIPYDILMMIKFADILHNSMVSPFLGLRQRDEKDDRIHLTESPNITTFQASISDRIIFEDIVHLLSPSTLAFYDYLYLSSDGRGTQYYDTYNAYGDRPLPILVTGRQKNTPLPWLGLFTTPDFFVYKDPKSVDKVYDFMSDLVNESLQAAQLTQDAISSADDPGTGLAAQRLKPGETQYRHKLLELRDGLDDQLTKDTFAGDLERTRIARQMAIEMLIGTDTRKRRAFITGNDVTKGGRDIKYVKLVKDIDLRTDLIYEAMQAGGNNLDPSNSLEKKGNKWKSKKFNIKKSSTSNTLFTLTDSLKDYPHLTNPQPGGNYRSSTNVIKDFMTLRNRVDRQLSTKRLRDRVDKIALDLECRIALDYQCQHSNYISLKKMEKNFCLRMISILMVQSLISV